MFALISNMAGKLDAFEQFRFDGKIVIRMKGVDETVSEACLFLIVSISHAK